MSREKVIEIMARAIAPIAWRALGLADTLAQENRRKASLRHAAAALSALEAAGYTILPRDPWKAQAVLQEQLADPKNYLNPSHAASQEPS